MSQAKAPEKPYTTNLIIAKGPGRVGASKTARKFLVYEIIRARRLVNQWFGLLLREPSLA
jgi:hypothetical protein